MAPADRDPLTGTVLADRYLIEEQIGEGGMGRVYRARHQRVGRQFAIKVLFGDVANHENVVSRFEREAAAAGRLSHRNVVSVVDFGEAEGGLLYLAMDFVEGENLSDIIKRERPFDSQRIMLLMAQMCQGLAHAHSKGLVHRDFKTDNILVGQSDDGEIVRIVDFGIAMLSETANTSERLTTHGVVVGTPAYMSPEQAAGDPLDHRTDLFSLGLVLYEMLSGVLPFQGSAMGIMRSNLALDPPPISERVPGLDVDPNLEELAHELMAKNPDDRPVDATEILQRLEGMWTGLVRLASAPGISGSMSASMSAGMSASRSGASTSRSGASASRSGASASSSGVDEIAFQATVNQPAMSAADIAAVATGEQLVERRRGWLIPGLLLGVAVVVGVFLFTRRGSDAERAQPLSGEAKVIAADDRRSATPIEPTLVVAPPLPPAAAGQDEGEDNAVPAGDSAGASEVVAVGESPDSQPDSKPDKPTRKSRTKRKSRSRSKAKAKRRPGDTEPKPKKVEPVPTGVTTKALTSRFRKVGSALESLHKKYGVQVSGPLRKRYFAVPFTDALTDPELRIQADASLRRLQRDIARATQ